MHVFIMAGTLQAVTVLLYLIVAGGYANLIRGLHPNKKAFYKVGVDFTCLDGSLAIPFSFVNDDYCDCTGDGSDEPGTAACERGRFFCQNKGHQSLELLSSRVNDGICDCCDGGDEYEKVGGVECPNTCEEMGHQAREEAHKHLQLRQEGYSKKQEYSREGKEKIEQSKERRAEAERELESLREELEVLKEAVNTAEGPEKQAKEEEQSQWEEAKEAKKQARRREEALNGFNELDTDSNGKVSVAELQARPELDDDGDGEVNEEEALEYLDQEAAVDFEAFYERVWDVVSDKCQFHQGQWLPTPVPSEEEEEDEEEEEEDDEEDLAQDDVLEYNNATKELIATADMARAAFKDVETKKKDLEREQSDLNKFLELRFGEDGEYASLHEKCFEMSDREYVYKLCLFHKVTQKGKSGGRETNLGTWGFWTGTSEDSFSVMKYDNGEKCWNGPSRSATITFKCGLEDQLVSASEPNRCEYAMEFTTPAACKQPHVSEWDATTHTEL